MRNTTHHRGRGSLAHHLGGKKTKESKNNMRDDFKERPKNPEPDNVGRKLRPAAHNKRQAGVAKRARSTVKRLGDHLI